MTDYSLAVNVAMFLLVTGICFVAGYGGAYLLDLMGVLP